MSKRAFHIYNILVLLVLLCFNLLVLFAFGIGEGGIDVAAMVALVFSFLLWGVFYFIQFVRNEKVWRIAWFCIMVVALYLWETGYGAWVGRVIF